MGRNASNDFSIAEVIVYDSALWRVPDWGREGAGDGGRGAVLLPFVAFDTAAAAAVAAEPLYAPRGELPALLGAAA